MESETSGTDPTFSEIPHESKTQQCFWPCRMQNKTKGSYFMQDLKRVLTVIYSCLVFFPFLGIIDKDSLNWLMYQLATPAEEPLHCQDLLECCQRPSHYIDECESKYSRLQNGTFKVICLPFIILCAHQCFARRGISKLKTLSIYLLSMHNIWVPILGKVMMVSYLLDMVFKIYKITPLIIIIICFVSDIVF